MTWLAWRQFRTQMSVVAGALVLVAVALLVTRPALADLYRSTGLADCGTVCTEQAKDFLLRARSSAAGPFYWVGFVAVYLIPAIIGIFWGAPMVARELESGTYRLVWSQSTTRSRWLGVKLLAGAAGTMLVAGLLSLAVTWWSAPFDKAYDNRLVPELFGARGLVPVAYAAFAFVLGVVVGTVLRRTVAAMALTLVLVAAVQVLMPTVVREHLIPPVQHTSAAFTADQEFRNFMMSGDGSMWVEAALDQPGAWVIENRTVTASGTEFVGPYNEEFCGRDAGGGPRQCEEWVVSQNLHQEASYQPASRFWPLQLVESGLILLVTGLLTILCFWWVRRRLT